MKHKLLNLRGVIITLCIIVLTSCESKEEKLAKRAAQYKDKGIPVLVINEKQNYLVIKDKGNLYLDNLKSTKLWLSKDKKIDVRHYSINREGKLITTTQKECPPDIESGNMIYDWGIYLDGGEQAGLLYLFEPNVFISVTSACETEYIYKSMDFISAIVISIDNVPYYQENELRQRVPTGAIPSGDIMVGASLSLNKKGKYLTLGRASLYVNHKYIHLSCPLKELYTEKALDYFENAAKYNYYSRYLADFRAISELNSSNGVLAKNRYQGRDLYWVASIGGIDYTDGFRGLLQRYQLDVSKNDVFSFVCYSNDEKFANMMFPRTILMKGYCVDITSRTLYFTSCTYLAAADYNPYAKFNPFPEVETVYTTSGKPIKLTRRSFGK